MFKTNNGKDGNT